MSGMAAERFGREIARIRRIAGITQSRLARMVGVSSSHLSNIERGIRTPTPSLVGALDHALGEDGRLIRAWEDLTGTGRPAWLSELEELERDALSIQEFQLAAFSGVLQIEAYASVLVGLEAPLIGAAVLDASLTARMERARRFTTAENPAMRLVIDKSVIQRRIGGNAVMAEQLRHVAGLIEAGRVSVQIIDVLDAHPGMRGPFKIISSSSRPAVVYAESAHSGHVVDEPDAVQRFRLMFGDLQAVAHSPERTLRLIHEELEGIRHE